LLEPEPIDRASLLDYVQVWNNGRWYEPPISTLGLANMMRVAPHHSSAIFIKRNLLVSSFVHNAGNTPKSAKQRGRRVWSTSAS
jgi:capsid portal protein